MSAPAKQTSKAGPGWGVGNWHTPTSYGRRIASLLDWNRSTFNPSWVGLSYSCIAPATMGDKCPSKNKTTERNLQHYHSLPNHSHVRPSFCMVGPEVDTCWKNLASVQALWQGSNSWCQAPSWNPACPAALLNTWHTFKKYCVCGTQWSVLILARNGVGFDISQCVIKSKRVKLWYEIINVIKSM